MHCPDIYESVTVVLEPEIEDPIQQPAAGTVGDERKNSVDYILSP